ncbi:hypothetical protein [Saccharothrix texasensis]|uniref:Glycosyl transferase family 2 n=1 Tax=Saccharothrix texasensis TaxID=103734 RepID=A0A3N1H170_9PSEU|nr:hypothetical protein [Saccharothrix texasensis]ROP36283.1 hypothetical protein EDD40_1548 [Saccharothrix texasensis]
MTSAGFVPGSVVVGYLDPGTWSAVFGLSYRDLLMADLVGPQRIVRESGRELRAVTGSGGIPGSRNQVAREFLDSTDAEWLFMVDSDMGFGPDVVERLVAAADPAERPVVGGLCFALKRSGRGEFGAERFRIQPTLFEFRDLGDEVGFAPMLDYPRDQLVPVGGTGAACLLIHRVAVAAVRERYGDAWFDPITHPTGDHGKPRTFSEDLSFCVRLAAVGVQPYVHTGVRTTHDKHGVFLDEDTYEPYRPAPAAVDE